jgi:hypothetical protein
MGRQSLTLMVKRSFDSRGGVKRINHRVRTNVLVQFLQLDRHLLRNIKTNRYNLILGRVPVPAKGRFASHKQPDSNSNQHTWCQTIHFRRSLTFCAQRWWSQKIQTPSPGLASPRKKRFNQVSEARQAAGKTLLKACKSFLRLQIHNRNKAGRLRRLCHCRGLERKNFMV